MNDNHNEPDATPYSSFINEVCVSILSKTPELPEEHPDRGDVIITTLANVNAGVLVNLLEDLEDRKTVAGALTLLINQTYGEIARMTPHVLLYREMERNPQ